MSKWDELKRSAELAVNRKLPADTMNFIGEADPLTILELISENERFNQDSKNMTDYLSQRNRERFELIGELEQLRVEVERLRKQIERMKNPLPILNISAKCMACGDFHEGMGNLPCPKMTPFAGGLPPANCRQRLAAEGKAYPRSSCAVCGTFSPNWRECDAALRKEPSHG